MTKKTCQIIIIRILNSNIGCVKTTKKNKLFSKPDYNQDIIMVTEGMPDANLNFLNCKPRKHYIILF